MTNYIQKLLERFTALKTGIHNFTTRWTGQPIAETDMDAAITQLNDSETAIQAARVALHEALAGGRGIVNLLSKTADQTENLARGIHSADPDKLLEYGIKERKEKEKIPPPGKAHIVSVEKDNDGVGLVVTIEMLPNADHFDIARAITEAEVLSAPDPKEFRHIKTTQKLRYVDDEVIAGKRYYYRVSGHNHNGDGEPSAVVSAIE
jgi:hypothetical protein